ncbi:hypothetical protein TSAR_006756, partial [Trichomalopsis sarcophagae]
LNERNVRYSVAGDDQYRGAGGSSSGSPPASLLVVPQPLTVKPSHPSHLNPHLGGPHAHPPRKYQCKMCPQVSNRCTKILSVSVNTRAFPLPNATADPQPALSLSPKRAL